MSTKNYNYETKCRRCNMLSEWHFSNIEQFTFQQFSEAMNDRVQFPRSYECEKCNKKTVQDVVSYSSIGGDDL